MKKRIVALVLAALTLLLCACNSTPNDNQQDAGPGISGKFAVGYGRVNITPEESVPLAGAGNTSNRMSEGTLSYLYTTCIAITDPSGDTVLLYSNDLLVAWTSSFTGYRTAISEATGIPVDNIQLSCTHTHNAPDLENSAEPTAVRYQASLKKWLVKAAQLALADRKPATMACGQTQTQGLNFLRHYSTSSGVAMGDNFNEHLSGTITGYVHEADHTLQLIKFTRDGGQDIVMANWQSHPHRTSASARYEVSSDLIGAMRDRMEEELGCQFIYFTGAAGNINPTSRISDHNITSNHLQQGRALAKFAIDAMPNLSTVQTGEIRLTTTAYIATVDHTEDHKVAKAKEVASYWSNTNDLAGAVEMARENEMNSPYHANGIIAKANKQATETLPLYALSIGDVAFITAPYEMYDTQGVHIREKSPYKMTFILTCANESHSYIPDEVGYDNNTYEANSSYYVKGTGELLANEYVSMLQKISQGN